MKLRMYLRGLGIGMAVSAVVLSVAMPKQKGMSDAEIIEKAKELGMVEEGSTLVNAVMPKTEDIIEEPKAEEPKIEEPKAEAVIEEPKAEESKVKESEVKQEEKAEEPEVKEPEVKQEEKTEEPKAEESKIEEPKVEKEKEEKTEVKEEKPEKKEEKTEKPAVNKKSVTTITIAGGSSSDVVARLLEKGGVIDSASKFDSYLCSHNLDHVICAGTHEIPAGADYETISKIITSR